MPQRSKLLRAQMHPFVPCKPVTRFRVHYKGILAHLLAKARKEIIRSCDTILAANQYIAFWIAKMPKKCMHLNPKSKFCKNRLFRKIQYSHRRFKNLLRELSFNRVYKFFA